MIDQYKKETSQIHAPADLILKTKQAVREEEKRIQRERVQQKQVVQGQNTAGQTKSGYGKVYRWALPVAAAVLFAVLMKVSTMMVGTKFAEPQSGSSANTTTSDTAAGGTEYEFAEAEADEESGDMDAGISKAFADKEHPVESMESATDVEEEGVAEEEAFDDMYDESASDAPAAVAEYDKVQNSENKFALNGGEGIELSIEEVKEIPDFYDDQNTKCVTLHGLQFYVTGELEDEWKAYVRVDETGYVISGGIDESTNHRAFARKAYELLAETVEGID